MSLKKILKEDSSDLKNKDQLYVVKLDSYITGLEILAKNLKKGKVEYQKDLFDAKKNAKNQFDELLEMYKMISMFNVTGKQIEVMMKDSLSYLKTQK
jgi:hypothetical protein